MNGQSLKKILQRARTKLEVNRREFLKVLATATSAVTGVAGLSNHLRTIPTLAAAKTADQDAGQNATIRGRNIWNLPAFTPAKGPFKPDPTWATFIQQYRFPEWYRDVKFGIWQHWSPQSVPEYRDSVSYTFTGTGIDYIAPTNNDEGNVDVYIDGTFKKRVNGNSDSQQSQVTLYSVTGLARKSHTIKLVKRSGTVMLLDAFKVHP
jgi:hypothetical protein